MARNSRVILSKGIRMDKNYQNCLTYSEQQMVSLCTSNRVVESNDYSFIREEKNVLIVQQPYGVCLQANYLAFQNTDYSNKWFFAFIDRVEYNSPSSTKIYYTIDEFSTWWSYWEPHECFIVREHTMDDTIGANTIPEGLDTGDYVANGVQALNIDGNITYVCCACTELPTGFGNLSGGTVYNGVFSGLYYQVFKTPQDARNFLKAIDKAGKADAVYNIFLIPKNIADAASSSGELVFSKYSAESQTWYSALLPSSDYAHTLYTTPAITHPNSLNGYVPKNNKLWIGDYNYLLVSNSVGQDYTYKYEDFINNVARFQVVGAVSNGASIKVVPMNYKLLEDVAGEESLNSYCYGITAPKYPTCAWTTDPYTNWLTQNSINIAGVRVDAQSAAIIAGGLSMVGGAALAATGIGGMAGVGLLAGGAAGMFNSMQSNYQRDMQPLQSRGSASTGDVTYSAGQMYMPCYAMTIKAEYARSIDDFLTRFGYKTNRLKLPNQLGRSIFNYVEIGKSEIIGYSKTNTLSVPAESMEIINSIYRSGVTLWHNHTNIGNYSLNNTIVQE